MAWRRTGNKPLSDPVINKSVFADWSLLSDEKHPFLKHIISNTFELLSIFEHRKC